MNPYSIYEKHQKVLQKWLVEQEFHDRATERIESVMILMGLPMAEEVRMRDVVSFYEGTFGFVPKNSLTRNSLLF